MSKIMNNLHENTKQKDPNFLERACKYDHKQIVLAQKNRQRTKLIQSKRLEKLYSQQILR